MALGVLEKIGFTAGATLFSVVCKDGLGFRKGIAAGARSYTAGGIRLCNIYLLLLLKIKQLFVVHYFHQTPFAFSKLFRLVLTSSFKTFNYSKQV